MSDSLSLFARHLATYNIAFTDVDDFAARFQIFADNTDAINAHNAHPDATYTMAHNHMSTWTHEEYTRLLGFRAQPRNGSVFEDDAPTADSVDWVTAGCVTPVKDQGSCGSCWAFSTTGGLEGAHCAAGKSLVSLSEQEIVDCDTKDGNAGCGGGDMFTAMVWTEQNKVTLEENYKYTGHDGTCGESSVEGVVGEVDGT